MSYILIGCGTTFIIRIITDYALALLWSQGSPKTFSSTFQIGALRNFCPSINVDTAVSGFVFRAFCPNVPAIYVHNLS
jgi:hypothetical protein